MHEMLTANAAVMRERNQPFVIESLTLDSPRADEVVVRIVATGVCHTDIAMKSFPGPLPLPNVLGHEGAGVVVAVGEGVRKVAPGDHVVLSYMSCGTCRSCVEGEPAFCVTWAAMNLSCARLDQTVSARDAQGVVHNHFFGQSSFSTYSLANERNVVKVPKSAPLELLGPLGCGVQTGAGAVMNALRVGAGDSFACFGVGSVGLSAIMAARAVGATTIIAVDPNPQRLELALELGATHAINPADGDVTASVREASSGRGVAFSLDTTGVAAVVTQALDVLANRGTCGILAIGRDAQYPVDARRFMSSGHRLIGIVEGNAVPDIFIPQLLELHAQGRFPFEKMITFYDFADLNRAVEDCHEGRVIKPVIRIGCTED